MDLGAVSMMIYGLREREEVLRFFQKVTGLRMNHNYVRPGGVAADLPPGWRDDVLRLLDLIPAAREYDTLMTGRRSGASSYRARRGHAEGGVAFGATGPTCARPASLGYSSGMPYLQLPRDRVRRDHRAYGDAFDR